MIDLRQGDCLEVMKDIPDSSIDLLITDPPYLHIKGGCKSKRLNVGCRNVNSNVVSNMSDFGEQQIYTYLDNVKKKMKKINMYVFCSKLQIPYYLNWALKNKLQYDVLFWYKNTNRMISTKAKSELYQKIFSYDTPKNKIHEAQKPIELLERIMLLSSNENDTILDCFMGSGSTGVACKKLNRNFIGIEIDEKYFKIAEERINNAPCGTDKWNDLD